MLKMQRKYFFASLRLGLSSFLFIVPIAYLSCALIMVVFISSHDRNFIIEWYGRQWPSGFDAATIFQRCFTVKWQNQVTAHHVALELAVFVAICVYFFFFRRIVQLIERFI